METFEGKNWAILKQVKVIEYKYLSFLDFQKTIDFDEISIEAGQNFEIIPHIFESATFAESEKLTDAGLIWEKNIQLKIPKLRAEVSEFLKSYENRKLAFLVTDMNDETHFVYPLRMTRQRNIPGQATTLNATLVEFSGTWNCESTIVNDYTSG